MKKNNKITKELEEEIIRKYFDPNKEHTVVTVALSCNVSVDTIRKIFRKRGLTAKKNRPFSFFNK